MSDVYRSASGESGTSHVMTRSPSAFGPGLRGTAREKLAAVIPGPVALEGAAKVDMLIERGMGIGKGERIEELTLWVILRSGSPALYDRRRAEHYSYPLSDDELSTGLQRWVQQVASWTLLQKDKRVLPQQVEDRTTSFQSCPPSMTIDSEAYDDILRRYRVKTGSSIPYHLRSDFWLE